MESRMSRESRRRIDQDTEIVRGSFEDLIYSANGIVWEAESVDGQKSHISYISPNVEELLGYSREEWLSRSDFCETCLHPDDRDWVTSIREQAIRDLTGYDREYRLIAKNGQIAWVRCVAKAFREDAHRTKIRGIAIDITEAKKAREAIKQTEELNTAVLSSVRDRLAVLDRSGKIIAINDPWREFAQNNGLNSIVGLNYLDVCRAARDKGSVDAVPAMIGIQSVLDGVTPFFRLEYPFDTSEGPKWFLMSVTSLKRPEGGAVISHVDITERKLMENELRDAEARNQAFIKAVPDLMFLLGRDGTYLDFHTRDADLLYVRPEEILGRNMRDILPSDLANTYFRCFEQAFRSNEPITNEYTLPVPMGQRWFEGRVVACDQDRILVIVRDITDRKRDEKELWDSRRYIQQIADTMPAILYLFNTEEKRVTYVNEQVYSILGYTPEEIFEFGSSLLPTIVKRENLLDMPWHVRELGDVRDSESVEHDYRLKHKDGEWRWFHMREAVFTRNQDGTVKEILGTAQDITERKLIEYKLIESQSRYNLATLAGGVSVWDYNLENGEIYCDPNLSYILGFTEYEKQTYTDWLEVIHPDDKERVLSHAKEAFEKRGRNEYVAPIPEIEYRVLHKDGSIRWFINRGTVLINEANLPYRVIGTITDITERKSMEETITFNREALQRTNEQIKQLIGKLLVAQEEERKRISRELHDDVNQQVAGIGIAVSQLKRDITNPDETVDHGLIKLQNRISDLSDSIRDLSHRLHSTTIQHVGLVATLEGYCGRLSREENINVSFTVKGLINTVPDDVALCLYRITQESLRNVIKHSDATSAEVTLQYQSDEVALSIIDRGKGFDLRRAKNEGGLGLISLEERVRLLDGSIQIISSPGQGTHIEAQIPLGGSV